MDFWARNQAKTYIDKKLPKIGATLMENISSLQLYKADSLIDNESIVSSLGRNVYKLPLLGIKNYVFPVGVTTPTYTIATRFNSDNVKVTNYNQNNLDILYTNDIFTTDYLLINGWDREADVDYNKTIKYKVGDVVTETDFSKQIYGHCVNKPFVFSAKTALFFGDSITAGYTSGSTTTPNHFAKLFTDKVGLTLTNKAKAGALFTTGYNEVETIPTTIQATALTSDFIIIAGGTNDYGLGADIATFKQTIADLCTYLQANFTGEVIFITPINRVKAADTYFADLNDYRNIIAEYADMYNFSVVDSSKFNFPKVSGDYATAMFGDGLHPSELGHKLYARQLQTVLC